MTTSNSDSPARRVLERAIEAETERVDDLTARIELCENGIATARALRAAAIANRESLIAALEMLP